MRDARDKNKADDEKRKVMIASVAHDLKTPLAVISGYAESLSDGMDDKDYTALILQKTEEMNSQVLTLVESSRNEIQSIGSIKESVLFGEFFKTEALKYEKLAQSKNSRSSSRARRTLPFTQTASNLRAFYRTSSATP